MAGQKIQFELTKAKLKNWLLRTDYYFHKYAEHVLDGSNKRQRRIFIDRGGEVLFVAHLDTVCKPRLAQYGKKRVYAAGLDDRLGTLVAYELSEKLGADLLLTDLEEGCQSTALYHECKSYNWIAEFDRAGGDTVTYDLENRDFRNALDCYFKSGYGSYSDICDLDTAACCVNIGIGYKKSHDEHSYVNLKTLYKQVETLIEFYMEYKSTDFGDRDEIVTTRGAYDLYDYEDDLNICELCGYAYGIDVYGRRICPTCFDYMYNKATMDSEFDSVVNYGERDLRQGV